MYITISIVLCTLYQHCLVYIIISIVLRNAWIAVLGRKARDLVLFLLPHSMLYVLLSPLFVEIQTQCPVEQQKGLTQALLGKVKTPVWNAYRFVSNNYSTPETNKGRVLLSCCLTSTEARWPIRDGDRVGRGRESEGSTAETARKRPERPWTAARTMEVLRRCPLAIAQRGIGGGDSSVVRAPDS